jgi:hypothetical protein
MEKSSYQWVDERRKMKELDDVGILSFGEDEGRRCLLEEGWRCVNEENPLPTSPREAPFRSFGRTRMGEENSG